MLSRYGYMEIHYSTLFFVACLKISVNSLLFKEFKCKYQIIILDQHKCKLECKNSSFQYFAKFSYQSCIQGPPWVRHGAHYLPAMRKHCWGFCAMVCFLQQVIHSGFPWGLQSALSPGSSAFRAQVKCHLLTTAIHILCLFPIPSHCGFLHQPLFVSFQSMYNNL